MVNMIFVYIEYIKFNFKFDVKLDVNIIKIYIWLSIIKSKIMKKIGFKINMDDGFYFIYIVSVYRNYRCKYS